MWSLQPGKLHESHSHHSTNPLPDGPTPQARPLLKLCLTRVHHMYGRKFLGDDMVVRLSLPDFQGWPCGEKFLLTVSHLLATLRSSLACVLKASWRMNCRELRGTKKPSSSTMPVAKKSGQRSQIGKNPSGCLTYRVFPWTQGQRNFTVL